MSFIIPGPEGPPKITEQVQGSDFIVEGYKPKKINKVALIDADYIKYHVVNKIIKDIKSKVSVPFKDPIAFYTQESIDQLLTQFEPKGILFCFSGHSYDSFRKAMSFEKKYKGTRSYELLYPQQEEDKISVLKYIKDRYATLWFSGLEADDLISMLQDKDTFIYSQDKDAKQVPGTHFDIATKSFIEVTEEEALRFLMMQMLLGDGVDNIGGLKSCGIITATDLLTNVAPNDMVFTVLQEYIRRLGTVNGIDCFVESWNLLKMRGNRGTYFLSNYKHAFDTLQFIKQNENL